MIERRKTDSGGRRLNKGRRIEDGTDMKRSYILPHYAVTPAPAVPTALTASAVSSSQINLSWIASAGPSLKDYGVYRQGAGLLGFVTATSFSDTGLTAGTSYTYFVTARNLALVESAPSNFVAATTQSAGGTMTHGQPFTVTGSSFGTKILSAPIWDPCTGVNPSSLWAKVYPNNNPTDSGYNGAYHATPFTRALGTGAVAVNPPNTRATAIFAGCSQSRSGYNLWNVGVLTAFAKPAQPWTLFQCWWSLMDSQWAPNSIGTDANENWKYSGYGFGSDIFNNDSHGPAYLYCDYQQNINFTSPRYEENDDSQIAGVGRIVSNPNNAGAPFHIWGGGPGQDVHSWLRRTQYSHFAGVSPSHLEIYENDSAANFMAQALPITMNDTMDAGNRSAWMMTYPRYSSNNNWMYYWGMYTDLGDAQLWLANNANWASATIKELQPWTAWAPGSISFIVQGDRLPNGPVHLHLRLGPWNVSGHQYLGSNILSG